MWGMGIHSLKNFGWLSGKVPFISRGIVTSALSVVVVSVILILSGCQVSFFSSESKGSPSTPQSSVLPPQVDQVIFPVSRTALSSDGHGTYFSQSSSIQIEGTCTSGSRVELRAVESSSQAEKTVQVSCILGRFELSLDETLSTAGGGSFSLEVKQGALFSEIADVIVYTYSESVTLTWVIDQIPPASPTLSAGLGSSQTTSQNQFEITGSCEVGVWVVLTGSDAAAQLCVNGSFSFTVSHLVDASYPYWISQRDFAGNESSPVSFTWVRISVGEASVGSASYTFEDTPVSSSRSHTFDLTNIGQQDLTITQAITTASVGLSSTDFSITGGTCTSAAFPLTLAPSSSCTLEVTFHRTSMGTSTGTLSLAYSDGVQSQTLTLPLSGAAVQASLLYLSGTNQYVSGSTFLIGNTAPNSSLSVTLTLKNGGTSLATFTSPTTAALGLGSSVFALTGGTCTTVSSLAVNGTCTLILSFTPVVSGSVTQLMTFSYLSGDTPLSATLNLQGIGGSLVMSGSNTYLTGIAVGDEAYSTLTVSNVGSSQATLVSYDTLNTPFSLVSGAGTTCSMGALAAGATCKQVIRYAPQSAGTSTATLTLNYTDAQGSESTNYALSGFAAVAPSSPTLTSILPSPVPTPSPSSSSSPYFSSSDAVTISGSCTSGNTVELAGEDAQTTSCSSGSYQFTLSASVDGIRNYVLTQVNTSQISSPVTSFQWERDTLSPIAPTVLNANPFTSGDNSIIVKGACEPGATVYLLGVSGPAAITDPSPVTCSSLGTYSITSNVQSTNGTYSYLIKQKDQALNSSPDLAFSWERNASLPSTPLINNPPSVKKYTNQSSIVMSGSGCTVGNTMTLVDTYSNTSYAGTCTVGGNFSVTVSPTPSASPSADPGSEHLFLVSQTDSITGAHSGSAQTLLIHDTVSPQDPQFKFPTQLPTYRAGGNYFNLGGVCDEEGSTLGVTGSSPAPFSTSCSQGSFRFKILETNDDWNPGYSFTVRQTDLAGNSSPGATVYWHRDSSLPPIPEIFSPRANTIDSNQSSLTVSGYCRKGYTVEVSGDVSASDVTTPAGVLTQTCSNGKWRFVITKNSTSTVSSPFVFQFSQSNSTETSSRSVIQWVRTQQQP